jgi:DNA-binding NarL/FixJ family response regulator
MDRKYRILIFSSEKSLIHVIGRFVNQSEIQTVTEIINAGDSAQATESLRSTAIDLLIIDFKSEGALEFLGRAYSSGAWPKAQLSVHRYDLAILGNDSVMTATLFPLLEKILMPMGAQ